MAASRALRSFALAAAAIASIATSPPFMRRGYPAWQVTGPSGHRADCARIETWISKSGKQGFGATLALRRASGEAACRLRVRAATFHAGPYVAEASRLPDELALADADGYVYLPFSFDNETLFNQSLERTELERGTLDLVLDVNGSEHRLDLELVQRPVEAHVSPPPREAPPPPPPPSSAPLILAVPGDAGTP